MTRRDPAAQAVGPVVRLLGQVTVTGRDGERPVTARMDRLVLARLVLAEGRAVAADVLVDALWGGAPPPRARNALQVKVSRLRRALGPGHRLSHAQGAYRLDLGSQDSDVALFRGLARRAVDSLGSDPVRTRSLAAAALELWRGDPLPDLSDDPVVHGEVEALRDTWLGLRELHAETHLGRPDGSLIAIAEFRAVLDVAPLRPRARLGLMHALERSGRRAEALAAFDAGRRLLLEHDGLEPPPELREALDRILTHERRAARGPAVSALNRAAPAGLLESTRWLADQGDLDGGLRLAIRGAWWWWMGGRRSRGRDLLEDLLQRSAGAPGVDGHSVLSATVWLGVFESHTPRALDSLGKAQEALSALGGASWSTQDALAAALIAERLYERGNHAAASRLLAAATRRLQGSGDEWGQAVCGTIGARGRLLAGDPEGAGREGARWWKAFVELGDGAGQVMTLDLLGYVAEVRGDLGAAHEAHREALLLATHLHAPDWEATQLTRLGSVETLTGRPSPTDSLRRALEIGSGIGSSAITALARNGLGVALHLGGDRHGAAEVHAEAWDWYRLTGSRSGLAYTGARLAMVGGGADGEAAVQAVTSLRDAVATNDPRAVAHSLEAVALTADGSPRKAGALAAAAALRRSTRAPLPAVQARPLRALWLRLSTEEPQVVGRASRHGRESPMAVARDIIRAGA